MRGITYYILKLQNWKQKAIVRRKIIEAKIKRIKELIASRDNWKYKYTNAKVELAFLKKEMAQLKKQLKSYEKGEIFTTAKAKHHSYGTLLVFFVSVYANIAMLVYEAVLRCLK